MRPLAPVLEPDFALGWVSPIFLFPSLMAWQIVGEAISDPNP